VVEARLKLQVLERILMANRAYLYFCDDVSSLTFEMHYKKSDGSERSYMDSRHSFPLAWFLFFESQSIKLVPHESGGWKELYLVREWPQARAAFERRVPLLLSWFEGEFNQADMDEFLRRTESLIEAPEETWLVVDPSELEIEDEHGAQSMRATFQELDDTELSRQAKFEALDAWTGVEPIYNLDRRLQQRRDAVFGFFYGPAVPGYFLPRQPWPGEAA